MRAGPSSAHRCYAQICPNSTASVITPVSVTGYGFLMAERLVADKSVGGKKNFAARQVPALPKDYVPRGSPARATARGDLDHDTAPAPELSADRPARAMSMLRQGKHKATLVTQ